MTIVVIGGAIVYQQLLTKTQVARGNQPHLLEAVLVRLELAVKFPTLSLLRYAWVNRVHIAGIVRSTGMSTLQCTPSRCHVTYIQLDMLGVHERVRAHLHDISGSKTHRHTCHSSVEVSQVRSQKLSLPDRLESEDTLLPIVNPQVIH
jgi:hypothetical protein